MSKTHDTYEAALVVALEALDDIVPDVPEVADDAPADVPVE